MNVTITEEGNKALVSLEGRLDTTNAKLVLRNMKPHVKEVFDITGFSHIITIQ